MRTKLYIPPTDSYQLQSMSNPQADDPSLDSLLDKHSNKISCTPVGNSKSNDGYDSASQFKTANKPLLDLSNSKRQRLSKSSTKKNIKMLNSPANGVE